jgi:peptidylprolyl isomerase
MIAVAVISLSSILMAADPVAPAATTQPAAGDKRVTATGLTITEVRRGSAEEFSVKAGDRVWVHYAGRLENGKEFDSSYKRGEAIDFVVGTGRVIKGWDEGIQGMKLGDKRLLVIPPALGYGDRAMGDVIPANSTLIFDVELVGVYRPSAGSR